MSAFTNTIAREVLESVILRSVGPEENCTICLSPLRWDDRIVNVHEGQTREIRRMNELTGEVEVININFLPHYFHEACIQPWSEQNLRCPFCNKIMGQYDLHLMDRALVTEELILSAIRR